MPTVKIAKYLAECGVASRRKSEELVQNGKVSVNGKTMANVASRIDPARDIISFEGRQLKPQTKVYYLLNKPLGYTSTTEDPHADKLVTDLVPKDPEVYPVGRLDKLTSGVLLLTNDGLLTQKLTHPSFEIRKEYLIITNMPLADFEIQKIRNGVKLEDGFVLPDKFEEISPSNYRIIIHSGQKHVVRRIIESVGKKVAQLSRDKFAGLTFGSLKMGQWRKLTADEIKTLQALSAAKKPPRTGRPAKKR
jgi:23S rRNA pseudouridine2605 synthase